MKERCSKYEGLFVFQDSEALMSHINECEDCKAEYEKQQKVSELINEVKFYYKNKSSKHKQFTKVACASILLFVSSLSLGLAVKNEDLADTLRYGTTLSAEDLGFPVDSYGLLMVDE